ncbi:MAG: heavy-metal-associated domain-containing protein [Verrucomicrobia bacterium]|nr:heavy-metal-associated domain-containing protein [Verrucomicrobiota bacterium]
MIRVLVAVLLFTVSGIASAAPRTAPKPSANSTNRLEITGMTCEGCVKGVTSELRRVPGVVSVKVTLTNKLAVVAIDTNRVSTKTLVKTIEEAGYTAKPKP